MPRFNKFHIKIWMLTDVKQILKQSLDSCRLIRY